MIRDNACSTANYDSILEEQNFCTKKKTIKKRPNKKKCFIRVIDICGGAPKGIFFYYTYFFMYKLPMKRKNKSEKEKENERNKQRM